MPKRTDDAPSLWEALAEYRTAKARLAGIRPCLSAYPGDPPGPGYPGTQCDLLDGHDQGRLPTEHRHRFPGTAVVVTW